MKTDQREATAADGALLVPLGSNLRLGQSLLLGLGPLLGRLPFLGFGSLRRLLRRPRLVGETLLLRIGRGLLLRLTLFLDLAVQKGGSSDSFSPKAMVHGSARLFGYLA